MVETTRTILLVDDERNILLALKRELHEWARERGLDVLVATSGKEGLQIVEKHGGAIEIIISDLRMPEMKGSDFLAEVKERYPDILTMMLTGYSETEEIIKAVKTGLFSYMLKPWDSEALLAEVNKAWEFNENKRKNERNAILMNEELRLAGELQKTILRPNLPSIQGVEFRVTYRPSPGLFCGGDYYDVISIGADRYFLLIGTVQNTGVRAAMITAILKAIIYPEYMRGLIGKDISPADFLAWLNKRMQFEFRATDPVVISLFAGVLDVRTKTLKYANANHAHPFLVTGTAIRELPVAGSPIGSARSVMYPEKSIDMNQGDTLLLYTGGITNGINGPVTGILAKVPAGEQYHKRLLSAALSASGEKEFTENVTIVTATIQ